MLTLGPGILFASTAIGTSHLVQATRAGADYGFALLWAVLAANIAKYPFFEFGTRYANATGTSLVAGYRTFGRWASWTYLVLTALTCAFVMGGVGIVTAAFLDHLFGASATLGFNATPHVAVATFSACVGVLMLGRYSALDKVIKAISIVLLIGTVGATIGALFHTPLSAIPRLRPGSTPLARRGIHLPHRPARLDALRRGPQPVDQHLDPRTVPADRLQADSPGRRARVQPGLCLLHPARPLFPVARRPALADRRHGLPSGTAAFAAGIIGLYTEVLGAWSTPFVGSAAFAAMLGTCIACLDGFSRSFGHGIAALRDAEVQPRHGKVSLVLISIGALLLIIVFPEDIRTLLDFGNILSFCVAPPAALAMLVLVTRRRFPKEARPGRALVITAVLGLGFLMALTVLYLRHVMG